MFDKKIRWNKEKNEILKRERGVSFEEVLELISKRDIVDIIPQSNKEKYKNQKLLIIRLKGYLYKVPFVEDENEIFLKTIFPDRRLKKIYE